MKEKCKNPVQTGLMAILFSAFFRASTIVSVVGLGALYLSCSSTKVLMTSQKEEPSWVYDIQRDFIVSYGSGGTAQSAQLAALNAVQQEIVQRIAAEVTSDEMVKTRATTKDGNTTRADEFSSATRIRSAYSGFLSGVSIANVSDYYWKKVKNRKEKKISYEYVIRYPFTKQQLDSLIADWNEKQSAFRKQLTELESRKKESYQTFEEICRDKEQANLLAQSMATRTEAQRAAFLLAQRTQWIQSAIVRADQTHANQFTCGLFIDGKPMDTESPPVFGESCISVTDISKTSATYTVSYDYSRCNCKSENHVRVSFDYGDISLSTDALVDLTGVCVDFQAYGTFVSEFVKTSDGLLGFGAKYNRTYKLDLKAIYKGNFTITRVDYSYERKGMFGTKEFRGTIDGISVGYRGQQIVHIEKTRPLLDQEKAESAGEYDATVTIYYSVPGNKTVSTVILNNTPLRIIK